MYFGNWKEDASEGVNRDFSGIRWDYNDDKKEENRLENSNVLFAWYGDGSYCGSAFVLFEKEGKLYEVNGDHCSCYGLEGQWAPEETSWEAVAMRFLSQSYVFHVYYDGWSEAV